MNAEETPVPTTAKIDKMTDHQRLVAFRLLKRRLQKLKKVWSGKVSAASTELEHLVDADTPKSDKDCRVQLEQIKQKKDALAQAKRARKTVLDQIESAMDEILYVAPAAPEQLELGATQAAITKATFIELRSALGEAEVEDKENAAKGETPKYPPEAAADMDDLRARLEAMAAESGLEDITVPDAPPAEQADPDGEHGEPDRPLSLNGGKGKASKGKGGPNLRSVK